MNVIFMGNNKDKDELKKLPSREENFIDWLNEVILRTDIIDYRYNLKGCGVWKAYGYKLRRNILNIIRNLLESTEIPHDEYLFPLLVPKPQFMKEAEHVKGFEEEVYWVTHGGIKELDIPLALRPTSETVMYPMFALWIRSHQDLPLKTYQIVNTFRWEGKNTRPLIHVREITTFKEAHTVHASAEEAEQQIIEALEIYKAFFTSLGLSFLINKRPKWDTFPGAEYTIAFDIIFPGKHKALQVGTVHNLGQTFAKTFDIKFEKDNGEVELGYQTCYGISERAIASVIGVHGDDTGLKLPPSIAPIQIVIVPILFKKAAERVLEKCKELKSILNKHGYSVTLDDRKMKPGAKFFDWEQKGVPLRIEVGPRDLDKEQITIRRRDLSDKSAISIKDEAEMVTKIQETLDAVEDSLKLKAAELQRECILQTDDLDEALEFVEENKGMAEIPFCGSEECAADIEKRVDGLKFLGMPARYLKFMKHSGKGPKYGEINYTSPKAKEIFCVNCSKKVDEYWTIGRTF